MLKDMLIVGTIKIFHFIYSCIATDKLKKMDSEKYEEVKQKYGNDIPKYLYFNKGL